MNFFSLNEPTKQDIKRLLVNHLATIYHFNKIPWLHFSPLQ